MIVTAYTISQGLQEGFLPVLNINLTPLGIPEDQVGLIGFWASITSCGGAFITGHFSERLMGYYKSSLLVLLGGATLCFIWMGLIVMKIIPYSIVQLYVSILIGMALNFSCTPLFLELGGEIAYPVGEGVVAGFMTFWWTVIGVVFLLIFFIKNIGMYNFPISDTYFRFVLRINVLSTYTRKKSLF